MKLLLALTYDTIRLPNFPSTRTACQPGGWQTSGGITTTCRQDGARFCHVYLKPRHYFTSAAVFPAATGDAVRDDVPRLERGWVSGHVGTRIARKIHSILAQAGEHAGLLVGTRVAPAHAASDSLEERRFVHHDGAVGARIVSGGLGC